MHTQQIPCPSAITQVEVFARGALVTRVVTLPEELPRGAVEIVVEGMTPLLDPGSPRVATQGAREVLGVRSWLVVPRGPDKPGDVQARLLNAQRTCERLRTRLSHVDAMRRKLREVRPAVAIPRLRRGVQARITDALAASRLVDARLERLDVQARTLQRQIQDADQALAAAELDARQARGLDLAGEQHPTRALAILLGPGAERLEALEFSYAVSVARWWPAYTARLTDHATRATLGIEAFVAQATLEDWTGARIALSTADLNRPIQLPELPSLRLGRAQPPPRSGYRPTPEGLDVLFAGYDKARLTLPQSSPMGGEGNVDLDRLSDLLVADGQAPPRQKPASGKTDLQDLRASTRAGVVPDGISYQELMTEQMKKAEIAGEDADERSMGGFAPQSAPTLALESMPLPMPAPKRGGFLSAIGNLVEGAGGGGSYDMPAPPASAAKSRRASGARLSQDGRARADEADGDGVPTDDWLNFDELILPDPEGGTRRGRLVARTSVSVRVDVSHTLIVDLHGRANAAMQRVTAPPKTEDPLGTRGNFDHRYAAEGTVDVPCDGQPHRISLSAAEAASTTIFRCIPHRAQEVYREIHLVNPFQAPLLAGPIDVFMDGALVMTSSIAAVDRGATIHFGLGVEDRIRVARNVRAREASRGLLGGSTVMEHTVTVELTSNLPGNASLTLIERVPWTANEDIKVDLLHCKPEAETDYDQAERGKPIHGGVRWKATLKPGASQTFEVRYDIVFASKYELIGGNRRD